jgi:hypothetical protein
MRWGSRCTTLRTKYLLGSIPVKMQKISKPHALTNILCLKSWKVYISKVSMSLKTRKYRDTSD